MNFSSMPLRPFGTEACTQYVHPAATEQEGLGYFFLTKDDLLGTSQGSWSPAMAADLEPIYAQTTCLAP